MSGRPSDNLVPDAKRRAGRQLTKDDGSDDDGEAVDPGNFARASDDVLKKRKIIKARRGPGEAMPAAANPFAGLALPTGGAAVTPAATPAAANPFDGINLFPAKPADQPATSTDAKATEAGGGGPAAGDGQPAAEAEAEQQGAEEQQQENGTEAAEEPAAAEQAAAPQEEPAVGGTDAKGAEERKEDTGAKESTAATGGPAAAGGGFGSLAGTAKPGGLLFGGVGAGGGFGSLASASSGAAFSFGAGASGPAGGASGSLFSFSTAAARGEGGATFSFGAPSGAAAAAPTGGGSIFGTHAAFGTATAGAFGAGGGAGAAGKPAAAALPQEQAVATGEEGESTVFSGEGVLFEFDAAKQWRERGRGEMRVNAAPSGQARLVMRQRGNLRLLLNANLWADMQVTKMEGGKGATFACINAAVPEDGSPTTKGDEGKEGATEEAPAPAPSKDASSAAAAPKLATFAFRVKTAEILEQFVASVNAYKAGKQQEAGQATDKAV